jgi:hypothetical protein
MSIVLDIPFLLRSLYVVNDGRVGSARVGERGEKKTIDPDNDKRKMTSSEEILRETMDWFFSNDALANKMEHWAKSNCDAFDYCADQDDFEKVENKLIYTDLYKQFVDLFEGEVATFLQSKGWSTTQLAAACGEDESGATLGLILAITDYPVFKSMMLDEKRKKVQGGKA